MTREKTSSTDIIKENDLGSKEDLDVFRHSEMNFNQEKRFKFLSLINLIIG